MNHFLNTGTWGINCRKDLRSHASFLETKILKADCSNEMHGTLPGLSNAGPTLMFSLFLSCVGACLSVRMCVHGVCFSPGNYP